jgi:trans-aconitate methyltransferase
MEGEYYKTKESVTEYIQLAEGYDGRELIEKLKQHLPANATLLEIGSGPGTDWNTLQKTYTTTGSDNSDEFLAHLKTKNPTGEFLKLDASAIETDQTFDGIYANKVMHHLSDKELTASIKRQTEVLNKGGIVCLSFWKGEGSEIFKGLFVNFHTREYLKTIFSQYFEIILLETYNEFEADDSILLIAKLK